jgi:hypothetical protein
MEVRNSLLDEPAVAHNKFVICPALAEPVAHYAEPVVHWVIDKKFGLFACPTWRFSILRDLSANSRQKQNGRECEVFIVCQWHTRFQHLAVIAFAMKGAVLVF